MFIRSSPSVGSSPSERGGRVAAPRDAPGRHLHHECDDNGDDDDDGESDEKSLFFSTMQE